jgi:hypothetical protein
VDPEILVAGHRDQLGEWVHCSGDGRAGAGDYCERRPAGCSIGCDRRAQRGGAQPEVVAGWEEAKVVPAEAQQRDGLADRHVGFGGGIHHAWAGYSCLVGRRLGLTRHCQTHQVCQRSTAGKDPAESVTTDRLSQP